MSGERSSVEIVRDLVDAWNSHDIERIIAFFHEDFENWQLPLPTVRGRDAYRNHLRRWFTAYPDFHMEIVSLFADGDRVCLETRGAGTATTAFFGTTPENGRQNQALDVLELRDGKVWRERGYWDFSLWTGEVSPLAGHPELRDAPGALFAAAPGPAAGPLCYVEYFRRLPGVRLDEFHEVANSSFPAWSERHPEDELVANLGRTWRLGPHPYVLIWRCSGIDRLNEWNELFTSGAVDDIEEPIQEVMATDAAGFYRELVPSSGMLDGATYYWETFRPWPGAADAYRRRAQDHGAELRLLLQRVGRLGPEPGGICLLGIDRPSDVARVQADAPPQVVEIGLYAPTGREIL